VNRTRIVFGFLLAVLLTGTPGCRHWIGDQKGQLLREEVDRTVADECLEVWASPDNKGGTVLELWERARVEECPVKVHETVHRYASFDAVDKIVFLCLEVVDIAMIPVRILTLCTWPTHRADWEFSFDNVPHNLLALVAPILPFYESCFTAGFGESTYREDLRRPNPTDREHPTRVRGVSRGYVRHIPILLEPFKLENDPARALGTDAFGSAVVDLPIERLLGEPVVANVHGASLRATIVRRPPEERGDAK
jgi:hypothetical protein